MKLNCDLGESFGAWSMPVESAIMAEIDQANIACGFHAGDPLVMKQAILLAKKHDVAIGAHPAYPDLQGFGRRSMAIAADELKSMIQYQVSALSGMAKICGTKVSYVKPHGALYNDMMKDTAIMRTVMQSIAEINEQSSNTPLALMVQATSQNTALKEAAQNWGLPLYFEAFSDRRYTDEGLLQSRTIEGAVLNESDALLQAKQLISSGTVTTASGATLAVEADSLCVHGDTKGAVSIASKIRTFL
ncbi:5-oxoprolinase subunit PxpA [Alteromonas macleodii]|uniref:5-oxoprolinase subunit A n=1 Tax=Alteromonas macleodii TaxID=28108 RepID=A0A6T9Y1U2_ALTMA|nr:5-oxoprolinase subunit PxpA [Alteromonas macleodii]CAB9494254.1 5-oxoprolinase subunit A [Alteromonas macleodii]